MSKAVATQIEVETKEFDRLKWSELPWFAIIFKTIQSYTENKQPVYQQLRGKRAY